MSEIRLGLIGKNIGHSKSQMIIEGLINKKIIYDLIDIDRENNLPSLDSLSQKYHGINITSPYKKSYVNDILLTEIAKKIGAINCLNFKNNKIIGTNTDYLAIREFFTKDYISENFHCVILGNGVMADCLIMVLDEIGYTYQQYSRKTHHDITKLNLSDVMSDSKLLVINTCSRDFVFRGEVPSGAWFWDFNYDFVSHQNYLLDRCEFYVDGLSMLKAQALHALKFWEL